MGPILSGETEVRATGVAARAGVLSARASMAHEGDAVESAVAAKRQIQRVQLVAVEIHALDAAFFPVGPEEVGAGVSDVEGIGGLRVDGAPVGGVVGVHAVHALEFGVGDAEEIGFVEDGQAVGQPQVLVEEDAAIGAVHVGHFDLGGVAVPVGPENAAVGRIGHDPAGIDQLFAHYDAPLAAVQFRHFHAVQLRVRPVNVSVEEGWGNEGGK